MNWIFKTYRNESFYNNVLSGAQKVEFVFSQRRGFRGAVGDSVLILDTENGWKFTHTGKISAIKEITENEQNENSLRVFNITMTGIEKLKEIYSVDDFAYSLHKVYKNFLHPYRHFRKTPYSRIDNADLATILSGKIFLKRTTVGKLLNALHIEHRKEFLKILMNDNPKYFFGEVDYVEIYSRLKTYIDENIMQHAFMLNDSENILIKMNIDSSSVGFEDDLGIDDTISSQAKVIRESLGGANLIDYNDTNLILEQSSSVGFQLPLKSTDYFLSHLQIGINENQKSESAFNSAFKGAPFPLQLN